MSGGARAVARCDALGGPPYSDMPNGLFRGSLSTAYLAASGQLNVPYSLDAGDMKMVALNGFTEAEQFFRYLRDTFQQLRAEGERMMSVGLHGRVAGRPGRAAALARFVDHVLASGDAWMTRRIDIARHWMERHAP